MTQSYTLKRDCLNTVLYNVRSGPVHVMEDRKVHTENKIDMVKQRTHCWCKANDLTKINAEPSSSLQYFDSSRGWDYGLTPLANVHVLSTYM